jgi:hypothetical protein
MQIDTKVFVPYTLHYSASAEVAAASPVNKLCSSSPADDGRAAAAAAAAADDDDVNDDEALGADTAHVDADGVDQPLVVVTAASADFFNNSLNLIGRSARASPRMRSRACSPLLAASITLSLELKLK